MYNKKHSTGNTNSRKRRVIYSLKLLLQSVSTQCPLEPNAYCFLCPDSVVECCSAPEEFLHLTGVCMFCNYPSAWFTYLYPLYVSSVQFLKTCLLILWMWMYHMEKFYGSLTLGFCVFRPSTELNHEVTLFVTHDMNNIYFHECNMSSDCSVPMRLPSSWRN